MPITGWQQWIKQSEDICCYEELSGPQSVKLLKMVEQSEQLEYNAAPTCQKMKGDNWIVL